MYHLQISFLYIEYHFEYSEKQFVIDYILGVDISEIQDGNFKFYQTAQTEEVFYNEISDGCVFFAKVNINGLQGFYTGFKATNDYGAMLILGYGLGITSAHGVLNGGTWTWKNL